MNARPKRQGKGDRLLNVDCTKPEIECDYGVAPFDRVVEEMDRKWGIDRLPELVSPETAIKYGSAIAQLNQALEARDPKLTAHKAQVCIRGLRALDAEAAASGHERASGDYWEYDLDGYKIGILKKDIEWKTAKAQRPDLKFFTMREAAIALKAKLETPPIAEVKEVFPGAEVIDIRERSALEKEMDDEIPW